MAYRRCSTGTFHFTQCPNSPTISQTYLPLLLLVLSNDRCYLTAFSVGISQVLLNTEPLLKTENSSHASNKLQSTLQANFTLVIYPLTNVAFIQWPDSDTLTGKSTNWTTFILCGSRRSGKYLYMEAASWHTLSPILSNSNSWYSHSTALLLSIDCFSCPTTYETVLNTWYSWINSLKLLQNDWCTGTIFMAMVIKLCPYEYI